MSRYAVNHDAVKYVEGLIDARQYVLDSDWGDRAAEWRHKTVELAAHELLQRLDRVSG